MSIDISFIIAAARNYDDCCRKTVDSIYQFKNSDMSFNIYVCYKTKPNDDRIIFIQEDEDNIGPAQCFNKLCNVSDGKYIIVLNDDYAATGPIFDIINDMKQEGVSITTLYPDWGDTPGVISKKEGGPSQYINLPFVVISRQFLNNKLSGYLFHPRFSHSHSDEYLSYYIQHVLGITIKLWPQYRVTTVVGLPHISKPNWSQDTTFYKKTLSDIEQIPKENYGEIKYV